jgi:hypothetical protein
MNFKYSLEEFMALPDSTEDREFYKSLTGKEWLWLYDTCKKSFEKYGEDGPPIGSVVTTLWAGHGGGPGAVRKFTGKYWSDDKWFAISRGEENSVSLVSVKYWWREIVPGDLPWRGQESIPWAR